MKFTTFCITTIFGLEALAFILLAAQNRLPRLSTYHYVFLLRSARGFAVRAYRISSVIIRFGAHSF